MVISTYQLQNSQVTKHSNHNALQHDAEYKASACVGNGLYQVRLEAMKELENGKGGLQLVSQTAELTSVSQTAGRKEHLSLKDYL